MRRLMEVNSITFLHVYTLVSAGTSVVCGICIIFGILAMPNFTRMRSPVHNISLVSGKHARIKIYRKRSIFATSSKDYAVFICIFCLCWGRCGWWHFGFNIDQRVINAIFLIKFLIIHFQILSMQFILILG